MTDSVERLGRANSGERLARTDERTNEEVGYVAEESFSTASPAGGLETFPFADTIHALNDQPTWVYHCHCSHGSFVYVGIAIDVPRRLNQHRTTKSWWSDVEGVIADLYPNREQARAVEAHYIRHGHEMTLHNIQGQAAKPAPPHRWIQRRDYSVDRDGSVRSHRYHVTPAQEMVFEGPR